MEYEFSMIYYHALIHHKYAISRHLLCLTPPPPNLHLMHAQRHFTAYYMYNNTISDLCLRQANLIPTMAAICHSFVSKKILVMHYDPPVCLRS